MEVCHQINDIDINFPFNLILTDMAEFPPHWHEEIEIIYVIDENLKMGLNNEIYHMNPRDILIVGSGDVHSFMPQPTLSKRLIIQFDISLFEAFSGFMHDRRINSPLIKYDSNAQSTVHAALESQLLQITGEYFEKKEGYKIALKARMYDLLVILLRQVPMDKYPARDRNRHMNRLSRLEQVFYYVEKNYDHDIDLKDISKVANFSLFHFTRFFKETTGMTFNLYLNHYRITKAIRRLETTNDPITEIAYTSGFNSIKTFNRVFRQLKGCSPSQYKNRNI